MHSYFQICEPYTHLVTLFLTYHLVSRSSGGRGRAIKMHKLFQSQDESRESLKGPHVSVDAVLIC